MLTVKTTYITNDDQTDYLVGPEGLVWITPALGEPFILAARSGAQRENAARFVGELLNMGLVPFGIPTNQRAIVATFGGSPIRDCAWVPWTDAPPPSGEDDDELPTRAAVIEE